MADDGYLQQEVLQKTLREVAEEDLEDADPCVICLETITEPCVSIPCKHTNFDYLCLISWLEQQPSCPLCKTPLTAVQYDLNTPRGPKTYNVPPSKPSERPPGRFTYRQGHLAGSARARNRQARPRPRSQFPSVDDPLSVRRNVYRHQLYSLRVGSNRLSQYTEVTPEQFNRDEVLISRARKWIRRELQVFSFLNPEAETEVAESRHRVSRPGHQRLEERRANNAEFLLEYVIAILRTVDLKGSAGQAEELLRDFIGRDNARLFLHELLAWLRSPYTSLQDWDRHVQYSGSVQHLHDMSNRGEGHSSPRAFRDRSASPARGSHRSSSARVSRSDEPFPFRRREARPRQPYRHTRPAREFLDRYIPD